MDREGVIGIRTSKTSDEERILQLLVATTFVVSIGGWVVTESLILAIGIMTSSTAFLGFGWIIIGMIKGNNYF